MFCTLSSQRVKRTAVGGALRFTEQRAKTPAMHVVSCSQQTYPCLNGEATRLEYISVEFCFRILLSTETTNNAQRTQSPISVLHFTKTKTKQKKRDTAASFHRGYVASFIHFLFLRNIRSATLLYSLETHVLNIRKGHCNHSHFRKRESRNVDSKRFHAHYSSVRTGRSMFTGVHE